MTGHTIPSENNISPLYLIAYLQLKFRPSHHQFFTEEPDDEEPLPVLQHHYRGLADAQSHDPGYSPNYSRNRSQGDADRDLVDVLSRNQSYDPRTRSQA